MLKFQIFGESTYDVAWRCGDYAATPWSVRRLCGVVRCLFELSTYMGLKS